MRKIAVVTGTRADYGIFKSILKNISLNPRMELSLIVVGMHLSDEFGYTLKEIEKDGFPIGAKIKILQVDDTRLAMAQSVGKAIAEISTKLLEINPDVLVVLGDRGEMLAGAVAATYLGIPIAHVHGGEISGNVDEPVRHAITKLSHIHFAATAESAQRIIKMGEESWRVQVVGAPGLDYILNDALVDVSQMAQKYQLNLKQPLILMVQHSVVSEAEEASNQILQTLEAIKELGYQTVIIYPNADAGGRRMIDVIKKYENLPFIKAFESLPHEDYLVLMKVACVMVGNSSSGIIEAPSFGLPVVNIGSRQMGRQRAGNVVDVGYVKEDIVKEVQKIIQLSNKHERSSASLYGDGRAGERIAKILNNIKIDEKLIIKRMAY
jgi:GDP/UDP-N,N'-diacetylbacillosamine 2-epimerase (hydrolysing)